jgi:phosphatidylserine/phosphatidylglycerophosphate/cardiolipin synthase-like enzyme
MRLLATMTILSIAIAGLSGCSKRMDEIGLTFSGETTADQVRLLLDETWMDAAGQRQVDQEIFDSVFEIIDTAEQFILIDFFLVNDFLYEPGPGLRPLSQELTDRLVAKRKNDPDVRIVFITDPINTVYGSVESSHFGVLEQAGVEVVWTDLDQLRDSNPLYSKPWRLLVKPWGTGPGQGMENPIGEGRISMRSMLKLLNFKANHRKMVVSEKSLLVTSANPHSASSAHWNVALRIDGAGKDLACAAESAIMRMSGSDAFMPNAGVSSSPPPMVAGDNDPPGRYKLELLTEGKIKDTVLELLNGAEEGEHINLAMFYFSDRDVIKALIKARKRGCNVRVILDPNKDAFGRTKNGIPNRQTAAKLVKAGVPVRWADTHGEQFHVKMLHVVHADRTAALMLGSCNFTRRNMDNFNAECDLVVTASSDESTMVRTREAFDRWWTNAADRTYTTDYTTFEDRSLRRKFRAWLMEATGLSSF